MAFIETPLAAELTLVFGDTAGNEWTNGHQFTKGATWDAAALEALVIAASDAFEELMIGIMTEDYFLKALKARDLSTEAGAYYELVLTTPIQGTLAGAAVPANACMTVTKRTGLLGRSFRGRTYWSGLNAASLLDSHTWSSPTVAVVTDAFTAWNAAIVADVPSVPVVISYQQGNVVLAEGDPTPITAWVARQPTASLRGRSGNGI